MAPAAQPLPASTGTAPAAPVPARPLPVRLPTLTGLRFTAAFAVFAAHTYFTFWFDGVWEGNSAATFALILARSGVAFFFLLSGFVLAWSARPGDRAGAFWRRRAAKIYPTHVVTWLAALLLIDWAGGRTTARQAVPNLFLVQSWWPVFDVYDSVNGVSWSLSCEAFFYLAFPLLIPLVRRIPAARLWACAGAAALAVILLPALVTAVTSAQPSFYGLPTTLHRYWAVYTFPPARLLEFVLGMLLARALAEAGGTRVRFRHALPALAAGYPLAMYVPFLYAITAVLVIPMALLVLAGAGADVRASRSPLRHRTAVWLGDISFAFYMVHMLVLTYGYRLVDEDRTGGDGFRALCAAALLAVSVAVSWALYAGVERPLTRLLGSGRRPVPRAPSGK
ncbi:acyltransferase family protein [Streptomyces mobaraensis]|uniref:acyltransferase family protein n=1 Tax=Streptomyces mobaraensis TaxID=35621 RepID=UPI001F03D9D1|nr:acyltransferase [Streptomyces mobaraensis]